MTKVLATLAILLALGACSSEGDPPQNQDPRLEKVRENAPSFLQQYTDKEAVEFMDHVCDTGQLDTNTPAGVSDYDFNYVQGLALGSCH